MKHEDLARHRDIACFAQHGVKSGEKAADSSRFDQAFAKQPDRLGVGNTSRKTQPQEAHERQRVVDQIFGALVRQCIDRLDHQYFEHQHRVDRWASPLAAICARQRLLQIRPERLKIHRARKGFQLIAKVAQPRKPFIHLEKSRLTHSANSINHGKPESYINPQLQRFCEPSKWVASS